MVLRDILLKRLLSTLSRRLCGLRLMLSQLISPLLILLFQQGHLRSRLITFSLQELADHGMLLACISCGKYGPDSVFANGRTHSFDRTPFDIAQMVVSFTGSVKSVAFDFVQYVPVGRCECSPWTDYKVLPGVTGHRRLRTGLQVRS